MKSVIRFIAIMLLVVIVGTAFAGCRRKGDDTSSNGLMSDVNSAASSVMSDVESGMDGIINPSTGSGGATNTSATASDTTSVN